MAVSAKDIIRNYTVVIVLILFGLGLGGYYWSLHYKPFTQNAFLITNTRPVSPLVEGYLTEVLVKNHQKVKKGEPLFTIFRPPYELKVEDLTYAVKVEEARLAGIDAKLKAAKAQVEKDAAEAANRQYLSKQAVEMYAQQAVSQTYTEEARRAELAANAQLSASKHQLEAVEREKEMVAAGIGRLQSQLKLAKIYLEQTTVYALNDGTISNMHVSPGGYYRPGDILFAFIESDDWFIQANFEETDLSMIRPGQTASIWLWQYPGKKFHGVVEQVSFVAERRQTSEETGVQLVEKENQWFLLPQRFPVQIRITDPDPEYPFNLGGSAFVQIDTSSQLLKQIIWRIFRWV